MFTIFVMVYFRLSMDEIVYGDKQSDNGWRPMGQPEEKTLVLIKIMVHKSLKLCHPELDALAALISAEKGCILLISPTRLVKFINMFPVC